MGLQKQTHKRSWIDLENFCKAFYLVQCDSHCSKCHTEFTVSVNTWFTVAKDYSLHPMRVNTRFCQAVSKGQMVSLSNAEGAVRKALPLVMYRTGENVTKVPYKSLMSGSVTDC